MLFFKQENSCDNFVLADSSFYSIKENGGSMLCIIHEIYYQSCADSDVCTYMSDSLDINYRIHFPFFPVALWPDFAMI